MKKRQKEKDVTIESEKRECEKEKVRDFPSILSISSCSCYSPYPSSASLPSHRRKVINTSGRCVGEAHTPVDRGIAGNFANLTARPFSIHTHEGVRNYAVPHGMAREETSRFSFSSLSTKKHVEESVKGSRSE